jgi:hypothetical protein
MSQWHVLGGDTNGNSYTVAFHLPIPSANNRAGVNYQTALVNSGIGGKTIMATGTGPGQISSTEVTQIQAGSVYEYVYSYATNPGNDINTDIANLNALYSTFSNTANQPLLGLQKQLTNYGGVSAA